MPTCVVRGCENETGGALQCPSCREGKRAGALPGEAPQPAPTERAQPVLTREEAVEQQEGINLLTLHGFRAWRVGQRRPDNTQDPGVSDVVFAGPGVVGFWEAKRSHNWHATKEQKTFKAAIEGAGVPGVVHLLGPAIVVERWLLERARRTA